MDPNETLRLLAIAILEENEREAREHHNNLRVWIERGGFEPLWECMSRTQFFQFNPRTGRIE